MATPRNPLEAFIWGAGGAALTPDEIARRREEEAAALAKGGIDMSPVYHPLQGLGRVAQAAMGAYRRNRIEGQQAENNAYNDTLIKAILGGGSGDAPSSIPTSSASGEIAATTPGTAQSYRDAIAGIESAGSGDYAAIGPTNDKLGRALGRYQIMEANIGPWSQAALGQAITPDQFLANPELQDKIFDHQFQQYVDKYGPEGAAQAWIGGEGGVGKVDRKDVLGTSVGEYGNRFMSAIGQQPQARSLSDEVAQFEQTPEYASQFGQQPLSDQAFNDRFSGQEPNQVMAQAMANQQAAGGDAVAQAQMAQPSQTSTALNPAILRVLADPRANAQTRGIAEILLKQQLAQQDQQAQRDNWLWQQQQQEQAQARDPLRQQQLEEGRLKLEGMKNPQPGYQTLSQEEVRSMGLDPAKVYQRSRDGKISDVGGSLVNVNVGGNRSEFGKESDKKAAERLGAIVEDGMKAGGILADMQQLADLGTQIQTGRGAEALVTFGPYLQALGIDVEGLDPAQAYRSIIDRLAPNMRPAGAGATSDFDARQFLSSLPALGNQPGANEIINQTFQGIAQNKLDAAAIARKAQREEITWQDAEDQISKLPNPYQRFKEWEKSQKAASKKSKRIEEMSDEELEAIVNGQR